MAQTGQVYRAAQSQAHKDTQLHVNKQETAQACIFTSNLSGFRAGDVQVQVEDEEALILRIGKSARKFELPANACVEDIRATWKEGVLTVTIPKMPSL